jgi:hypothetical protein
MSGKERTIMEEIQCFFMHLLFGSLFFGYFVWGFVVSDCTLSKGIPKNNLRLPREFQKTI